MTLEGGAAPPSFTARAPAASRAAASPLRPAGRRGGRRAACPACARPWPASRLPGGSRGSEPRSPEAAPRPPRGPLAHSAGASGREEGAAGDRGAWEREPDSSPSSRLAAASRGQVPPAPPVRGILRRIEANQDDGPQDQKPLEDSAAFPAAGVPFPACSLRRSQCAVPEQSARHQAPGEEDAGAPGSAELSGRIPKSDSKMEKTARAERTAS
ncbi:hypothetical protein R6Z07M_002655 [Ovis aries]